MSELDVDWRDFQITCDYTGVVNYALRRNDLPVVEQLHIEHTGDEPVEELELAVRPTDTDTEVDDETAWTERIARLEPGDIWNARRIDVDFPKDELIQLDERRESRLALTVGLDDETSEPFEFEVERLPYNHWPGARVFPQSLAAFVLPNHPDIQEVVNRMRDVMERWTGDPSLEGYQTTDRQRLRKMVGSAHVAIRELGFSYVNPPASFAHSGQKVRTPEQMLNSRMGTCLDLTLLAAAALEHVGLRPILAVIEGHAFVGAWLEESTLADPLVDDAAELRKRAKLGQAVFFDPTQGVSNDLSFEKAEEVASGHLEDVRRFVIGIDVHATRLEGILPIASRVIGEDGKVRVFDHTDREHVSGDDAPDQEVDLEALEERAAAHLEQIEETDERDEDDVERLERWRSKLLDLSLRNRLLNFKHTLKTSALLFHDLGDLEDELAAGASFDVTPKPNLLGAVEPMTDECRKLYEEDQLREKLDDSLANQRLHSAYPPAQHEKRLKKIHRTARREQQETGVNLLHVALGFLRWFDPNSPNRPRRAPLILLPASLERQSATDRYELELTDDEAFVNQSLLQKLKKEFGI
jgi:hypothetical protein